LEKERIINTKSPNKKGLVLFSSKISIRGKKKTRYKERVVDIILNIKYIVSVRQTENIKDTVLLILKNFINNKHENKKDNAIVKKMSILFIKMG